MKQIKFNAGDSILTIIDIEESQLNEQTIQALDDYGPAWADQNLNENIYNIYETVESIKQFGKYHLEALPQLEEIKQIMELHGASYMRKITVV